MPTSEQSNITIIGALAFFWTSKLSGSNNFQICLCSNSVQTSYVYVAEFSPDLSIVPPEYYKFVDIFSKFKAKVLAPYHIYDLKINLKEDTITS